MTTLNAEKRDMSVKAKALRRQGKVVGNIFGRELKETIPVQFDKNEADHFLAENPKGSQAILVFGNEKMKVLLKDATYEPLKHQYDTVDFQQLVDGEAVSSSAMIILDHMDKVEGYLYHALNEVDYKAVPSALVDKVEIDVAGMKAGTSIYVKDLELAKNPDVELITPEDTLVLHVSEVQTQPEDEEETTEE